MLLFAFIYQADQAVDDEAPLVWAYQSVWTQIFWPFWRQSDLGCRSPAALVMLCALQYGASKVRVHHARSKYCRHNICRGKSLSGVLTSTSACLLMRKRAMFFSPTAAATESGVAPALSLLSRGNPASSTRNCTASNLPALQALQEDTAMQAGQTLQIACQCIPRLKIGFQRGGYPFQF